MRRKKSIKLCNEALDALDGILPTGIQGEVTDLINKYDEWGLGIELACDTIAENEISINSSQLDRISIAMKSMGIKNSSRIEYLRKHNVKS